METKQKEELVAERNALVEELYNCEPGAFPGSAAAKRESKALMALAKFDEAHPEIRKYVTQR